MLFNSDSVRLIKFFYHKYTKSQSKTVEIRSKYFKLAISKNKTINSNL